MIDRTTAPEAHLRRRVLAGAPLLFGAGLLIAASALSSAAQTQQGGVLGPEEGETLTSWTARWLDGPVQYITSEEEAEMYGSLQSTQERLQFIRLFWERRDTEARGPVNEFREEFEKRLAYANENFGDDDDPGWETIFGRVALVIGIPDRTTRSTSDFSTELSERPIHVWSYDARFPDWPVNENFVFVYRFRSWRLLPHTEIMPGGESEKLQREWENTSTIDVIPTDFLRTQKAIVEESFLNPVRYRTAIEEVRAEVAFPAEQIPFGWEASFAPDAAGNTTIDVELSMRMESLIFHRDEDRFETRMLIIATLIDEDGEVIAEATDPIELEVEAGTLESRGDEIVTQVLTLQAPPGTYTLRLVVEDPLIGYRTRYAETLEVPSS